LAGIDGEYLKQIVEALIFASDEPISAEQLKKYIEDTSVKEIKKAHDKNKPSPELEKTLEGVDWGNYGVEDIDK